MKYYIKATNGEVKVMGMLGERFSLDEMKNFVGGWVERVPMQGNSICMFVDEEGFVKGKPINMAATKIIRSWQESKGIPPEWRVSAIVGDAVICSAAFGGMNVNNLNKVLALIGRKFKEEGEGNEIVQ